MSSSTLARLWQLSQLVPLGLTLATYARHVLGLVDARTTSWPFQIRLFIALAQRRIRGLRFVDEYKPRERVSERERARHVAALRDAARVDRLTGSPRDIGTFTSVQVPVRQRELGGLLADLAASESGERTLGAEWVVANSKVSGHGELISASKQRVVLYFHGGYYIKMSPVTHRPITVRLSDALDARVLSLDYRLAPEAPFPAGIYDCLCAFLYVTQELAVAPENVIIAGDSAGGGLCLALMLYLAQEGLPSVGGAILISPFVDPLRSLASWEQNSDVDHLAPVPVPTPDKPNDPLDEVTLYLTRERFWRDVASPFVSPASAATPEQLARLPPVLIQTGGVETLLHDTVLLNARVRKAKVQHARPLDEIQTEVYDGGVHVPHMFPAWYGLSRAFASISAWAATHAAAAPRDSCPAIDFGPVDAALCAAFTHNRDALRIPSRPIADSDGGLTFTPERKTDVRVSARANAPELMREAIDDVADDQVANELVWFRAHRRRSKPWLGWLFGSSD